MLHGALIPAILSLLWAASTCFPQNEILRFQTPVFEDISIEDGLPENSVTCILQDYLGYLWLGTQSGLVRYDGYSMEVFTLGEDNPGEGSPSNIVTIYEDRDKALWIATLGGLFKLKRATDTFESFTHDPLNPRTINSNQIHTIYEDGAGQFWVGTYEGMNLLDRKTGLFTRFYFTKGDSNLYDEPVKDKFRLAVYATIEDPATNSLLFANEMKGVWVFDAASKRIRKYDPRSDSVLEKKVGEVHLFHQGRNGLIWMASYNTLSSLDPKLREFKSYLNLHIRQDEKV